MSKLIEKICEITRWDDSTERTTYKGYIVGDVIISDGYEPYTGSNPPINGAKYRLTQKDLSGLANMTREKYYSTNDWDNRQVDKIKYKFKNTPPISDDSDSDGRHRTIAAIELGHKTMLQWVKL